MAAGALEPVRRRTYRTPMVESPVHLLRLHARHAPFNARGLAAHATALVDAAGVRPTNASARSALSPRAVRFYVANGLIDRPEGTSLETIKREMRDSAGDALERRVATSLAPALAAGAPGAPALARDAVPAEPAGWRRLAVGDGIELHVRDDVPAARDDVLLAMREAVRAALGRRG
jgi:hypothetical protein